LRTMSSIHSCPWKAAADRRKTLNAAGHTLDWHHVGILAESTLHHGQLRYAWAGAVYPFSHWWWSVSTHTALTVFACIHALMEIGIIVEGWLLGHSLTGLSSG
jgi:hypothetical protein